MAIRPARIGDTREILQMIKGLAQYERALDEVVTREDDLEKALFGEKPEVYCHVATSGEKVIGIAIWHLNYSTWLGKHGMFLEDLFVDPKSRGQGHGLSLLRELANICVNRGYERLQWSVLDWNQPSIEFYKSMGAIAMDEWTVFRLSGSALKNISRPKSK
jgi:GNAT superfamily N-acetyltransferase